MAEGMTTPLYTTELLRLAASIPDPKALDRVDRAVETRAPTCGSRIRMEVQLDDEGRVAALSQQVEACAFGQASAALMSASAIGCDQRQAGQAVADLGAWLSGEADEPGNWPGLRALEPARSRPGRHGAILLPFKALLLALEGQRA